MQKKCCINIDDFIIEREISQNDFCHTYLVKNKNTKELCVSKVSNNEDNPDYPNENIFFHKEMNILSKISHPSIVKFIGYSNIDFEHIPKPVIFTEFCKNGSLRSLLNLAQIGLADHSWDNTSILKTIYGIANAMAFLHSHDIIHRNLKPENILLDENYNPKISNFSLAEIMNESKSETAGTPIYMAPEIWENGNCSKKSDVYAFSMIVYELLTLKNPLADIKMVVNLASYIVSGKRPTLDDNSISECFKQLIAKCWDQNPDNRPSFDEISHLLKTDHRFTSEVDKDEFLIYVELIDNSDIKFESDKEIIPISEETINQPLTKELKKQFKTDPQKMKYFMILESKQEINLLFCHFCHNQNLNIDIDLDKLKRIIFNKYKSLAYGTKNFQENFDDITKTIDDEYNRLYNQIKTKSILSSSLTVLNQVIKVLEDSIQTKSVDLQKIQEQIIDIHHEHPEKLVFDKDKLLDIPFSSTPISEMLLSLKAIKENPKFRNPFLNEQPKKSVLYSPSAKTATDSKSLANILSGNCFFITLYGNQSCTNQVLSSLTFNKIEKNQIKDAITIYGPVDFVSFGKTVSMSLDMLKRFNGNFPNLYFIEISNEYEDQTMKEWCEFISYISHYLIFCSFTIPTQKEIDNFKNSSLLKYLNGSLINCSPFTKETINFGDSNQKVIAKMNINIDFLLDNILLSYLFAEIFQERFNFIPSETVASLSVLILGKKIKTILQKDQKENFKKEIMQNYSYQIHNRAIQYFHAQLNKKIDEIYTNIESGKCIDNFHLDELLEYLKNKTQEFLYTNIYTEFWNDKEIETVSKVINSEVKNDFESAIMPIKYIEAARKLLTMIKSKSAQSSFTLIQQLLTILNGFDSIFNTNIIPKTQEEIQKLNLKVEQVYQRIISTIKEKHCLMKIVDSFSDELYSYLEKNPIASDQEYSIFYNKIYESNDTSRNPNIEKYINITLNIRKVLDEYKPKKFTVEINQNSFKQANIVLKSNVMEFVLNSSITCHEFFNLIKKTFELENIHFHIRRMSNNQFNKPIEIEVLNDNTKLSLLNSYNFTVYYGVCIISTQVLIESLIVQNTIKISDDFIIKSNSKNAKYTVDFPQNHKGWFDVEFDIKDNSTKKDECDYSLIYLTMTAEETSFLQEGNLLFHQSYQNGQWIDEFDPIFLSFPDCKTAVFPIRHCSRHKLLSRFIRIFGLTRFLKKASMLKEEAKKEEVERVEVKKEEKKKEEKKKEEKKKEEKKKEEVKKKEKTEIKKDEIENQINLAEFLDYNFSRDWEHENGDIKYMRGDMPYYLPVGFISEGIKVEKFKEYTCVGFHATYATVLFKIIQEGFKLPSELPGKGVRDYHIALGTECYGIKNFANAIFVSPSILYSSLYGHNDNKIVAESNICTYVHVGHIEKNQILIIILQTRVTPKSFQIIENTTPYKVYDQHYDNDHVEWRIPNKKDIFPYRILFKTLSEEDYSKLFEQNQ